ncbi:hypothetical protein H112_08593 [Trichophyton rubrum D6]|nr:hypothetical protein H100_08615 [Trichophyton rubrum MR850]EZF36980.1 hypothetical protein H102_08574 [Trichophyton rubrum CBS 100081]EZF47596.1 hypothetical protein H103_08597 [Trichophyton rubrum CBS 288.86]EZF58272.1 hypothetical protein H104_08549 [Trichophyton rubrum CBS 289.86]EZF79493.1 hypothetical protein H110_08598 [Trichophyton rubrum MR1448]EZG11763.1 hypothetical protein H107_08753 [Trichophyton rubrum CBS 202.88]KDB28650.1 hypothetical protein H112_08593 [Trichophyton rubrum 
MSSLYDYIICGGGTSGCVVAARLAEDPNLRILVLEAGPDSADLENVHMVGGWLNNFDSETDWNIITNPMPGVDGREIKLSRGRFLGGCSGCNGTLCIRGCKQDYDDWGLEGWSGEEFFKCMSKAETYHPKPWLESAAGVHGTSGPIHTEPHDLAPISKRILDSFVSKGIPYKGDLFSTGEVSHGCGHVVRTVHKGLRSTAADYLTKDNRKDNVTILCNTSVDKVIIEPREGCLKATGVATISTVDKTHRTFQATREVIISGGAYCSPAILLRSGIGPKEELNQHGIPCKINLSGVGKNLMDHLIVAIFYETEEGLTNDNLVYHKGAFEKSYSEWKESKSGFLSSFPFGAFAFARVDDLLADVPAWKNAPHEEGKDPMGLAPCQPNIELFNTECYGGPKHYNTFPTNSHTFSFIAELFGPRSRGSVTLKSTDPLDPPAVDCNYLDDPLDMLVITEACRLGNEILTEGLGTKDIIKGSWPPELKHHTFKTRDEWIPYVKEHGTTCKCYQVLRHINVHLCLFNRA